MKKKLLAGLAMGLFVLGSVGMAGASLVAQDLSTPGDSQLTYDSDTGLSWLNVSNTTLHSYNEIISGFGEFITTKGFRYATGDEVGTLLANYGITQLSSGTYATGAGHGAVTSLMTQFLGVTWANYNSRAIVGITGDADLYNQIPTHHFAYLYSNDYSQWTANQDWSQVYNDYAGQSVTGYEISSFLVKDAAPTATPIPGAVWLLGSGLAGLIGARRKKKA
ncbi:MAG: VPLPA-CTERM sorting domain-containing protein [Proteobacteria bacterium]|nr:VPLPA-CTERM sorting domain-containing protein [Pseudomonadota bacterium]MBU4296103.1 VPLPA-CTERM sorting domain-containing protein [Pseudomonadota bacterium]MCG2746748.1 VPLPA-CTERM sorting domain-containing protein [Desulfobulbaceae bacterium]